MSEELLAEVQTLRERVAALEAIKDRQEIFQVPQRLARGVDRHDAELMTSCFWEDGYVGHGTTQISGPEYGDWSNTAHEPRFALHSHNITNQNILEIAGDVAYCESYVITGFMDKEQRRAAVVYGRYIDQLERRNGEWRIKVRRALLDLAVEGDASYEGRFRAKPVDPEEFWTRKDVSYQRPIDFSVASPRWSG